MQASIPTSKYSRLKSATNQGSASRHNQTDDLPHGGNPAEAHQQSDQPSASSRSPSRGEVAVHSDHGAGRPTLDARIESSGSIRRAHPARYRARHPDDLDPHRDLDAESSDEEEAEYGRQGRGDGSARIGNKKVVEDESVHTNHPSEDESSAQTPPGAATWIADPDDHTEDGTPDHSPLQSQRAHAGPSDRLASDTSEWEMLEAGGSMDEVAIKTRSFHGLTEYPLDLGKSRRLIDDDYLKNAFGITMSRRESEEERRRSRMAGAPASLKVPSSQGLGSPRSNKSGLFEMDLPLLLDPRELEHEDGVGNEHVSLDEGGAAHPDSKEESDGDSPHSAASSVSTLRQAQKAHPAGESVPATAVAIVSPDQVLESPKPRRPFSTVSIDGMTASQSAKVARDAHVQAADSSSSAEEASGQDEKPSDLGTGSSMSSAEPSGSPQKQEQAVIGPNLIHPDPPQDPQPSPERMETFHDAQTMIHPTETVKRSHPDFPPTKNSFAPDMEYSSADLEQPPLSAAAIDTANMYQTALAPPQAKGAVTFEETQRPVMRRHNSDNAIKRNAPPPNVNKPLPPEPPNRAMGGLSHISEASESSQGSSATLRHDQFQFDGRGNGMVPYGSQMMSHGSPMMSYGSPGMPQGSPMMGQGSPMMSQGSPMMPFGSPQTLNVSRMDSRVSTLSGWSLRSKYTPKDLDALDDAFVQRGGPDRPPNEAGPAYQSPNAPNQFAMYDQYQLATIREASPHVAHPSQTGSYHKPTLSDPYQRSRGPMRMEPGRRAPQPPMNAMNRQSSLISMYHEQPRPHGAPQAGGYGPKEGEMMMQRSATVGASLGKPDRTVNYPRGNMPPLPAGHSEAKWPRQESEPYSAIEPRHPLPFHAHDDTISPIDAPHDVQVAEIRERMELLSPRKAEFDVKADDAEGASPTQARQQYPGASRRWKRTTPLAELPAQRSPQMLRARGVEFESVDPESADARRFGYVPQIRPPPEPTSQQTAFVPPPPPPPPLSNTPPPGLERRSRTERSDSSSSRKSLRTRSDYSQRVTKVRSIASLVASEIPDIYALMPSNVTSLRPSMTAEEAEQMISAEAAERVLFRILQNLETFADLFAAAQVSRGFYRTFKRHELSLLKSALSRMSPPAWELREISIPRLELLEDGTDYMPNLYFSHYMRDFGTLTDLKALILENCQSLKIRAETVQDLRIKGGQTVVDAAFWRIWTFCKHFGCGSNREQDIIGQMDWLRGGRLAREPLDRRRAALAGESSQNSILYDPPTGFAAGNGSGLSPDELYDMTEIWECLGALLRGYMGQRQLAGEFGVFDRMRVIKGDEVRENALIDEWTYYLLSRAPHVILRAAAPTPPTRETMARLRHEGLTDWKPLSNGQSRSMFLKEALSHVYDEQMRQTHPLMAPKPSSPKGFSDLPQVVSPSSVPAFSPHAMNGQPRFYAPADLRRMNGAPMYGEMNAPSALSPASPPMSAPMSNFHEVLARIEQANTTGEGLDASSSKKSKKFGRKRAKTGPDRDKKEKDQLANIEAILYPPNGGASISAQVSPTASHFPRGKSKKGNKGSRTPNAPGFPRMGPRPPFAMGDRPQASQVSLVSVPSMPDVDGMSILTQSDTLASPSSGDQSLDPLNPMVEQLVAMGFDDIKSRKALIKCTKHNFIDFEQALASLVKQREIKKKMERLDRMG